MDMKKSAIGVGHQAPLMSEIFLRVLIWASFLFMELLSPFVRVIQPEEMWLYKYPHTGFQYVTGSALWVVAIVVPMIILTLDYVQTRNRHYYRQALLSMSLLLGLNGFLTVFLKIIVGRPRPDFFYRCFPDGKGSLGSDQPAADLQALQLKCTGDRASIIEGRKSFPSGHASFSFASMMFLSLMFANRLRVFDKHRGETWRLLVCAAPLLLATTIAVSRTCDYHHHWQDVLCGGIIGSVLAYVCYHQYLPAVGGGGGGGSVGSAAISRSSSIHSASVTTD